MSSTTIMKMFVLICLICLHEASSDGDLRTFWQVTDIHWDRLYSITGDPKEMCHGYDISKNTGTYGNPACDTSSKLYRSSLKAMYQLAPDVDFILWTGDNAPHLNSPNITWDGVYETMSSTASLLRNYFPSTIILPVLGNHDTLPADQFPTNEPEFYNSYLSDATWNTFISDNTSKETFLRGGYYSKEINSGLKVLVLNTILYMQQNKLVNETTDLDPSGQMSWIEEEFQESRTSKSKVIVTGHVAPGFFSSSAGTLNMKPYYNDKFLQLMANNSDVIMALIFGHEHADTFRIISDTNGQFKVPVLLASSVTPWICEVNPSIRLYTYNTSSEANIEDYYQFYLNYEEANGNITNGTTCTEDHSYQSHDLSVPNSLSTCVCDEDNVTCAEWQLLYRPTEEYNIPDLSLNSMIELYYKLKESQQLFDVFERNNHLDYNAAPCNEKCHQDFICSFANITEDAMMQCIQTKETYYFVQP